MPAAFEFLGYNINKMVYELATTPVDQDNDKMPFENEIHLDRNNEDSSMFRLSINVNLKSKKNICLEMFGYFKWNLDYIEKETEKSLLSFGTTILYPYARSVISSLSILDGGEPIIIPTINPFDIGDKSKERDAPSIEVPLE